jgi:hypothetical protein
MTVMKKYIALFLIASVLTSNQALSQTVTATIGLFPYQHRSDADAALAAMNSWKKSDWKSAFKLLDDDSLKVKTTYALSLYINTAPKEQSLALLKKYAGYSKSTYAQSFLHAESNLLTDTATINRQNASLPPLPAYTPPPAASINSEQRLLQLEDKMTLAQNPIEKKRILAKVAAIPGFPSFILVSKSLYDPTVNADHHPPRAYRRNHQRTSRPHRTREGPAPDQRRRQRRPRRQPESASAENALRPWLCIPLQRR